jgi:hypothetical protein
MGEDRFEMGQKERDRLKVLHEARQRRITQGQAAEQLKMSERQVRRLIAELRRRGDRAILHGLRGRKSNRRIADKIRERALELLSHPECRDFGPTYAAEYVSAKLGFPVGRDTVRKWMIEAGLWQARQRSVKTIHTWRQRRACFGELVQWDTSVHDWMEGRGERLYLIAMIDDATSRVFARFVRHDSSEANMRVLWEYLTRFGRPLEFYTDKAAMFEVTPKRAASEVGDLPLTQLGRALAELGIHRTSAHSPQAKGRVERFFGTAKDRLVKGLRLAGACSLEDANAYLEQCFLPEWNRRFTVEPANSTDAHRPLSDLHDLSASLSHVETRQVHNDYTIQFRGHLYQIAKPDIRPAMRRQQVRVEARLDGSIAARYQGSYVNITACPHEPERPPSPYVVATPRKDHNRGGRSSWMRNFHLDPKRPMWQVLRDCNGSS